MPTTATTYAVESIVRRLASEPKPVKLDPIIVIAIITSLTQLLMSCRETPSPDDAVEWLRGDTIRPLRRRRLRNEVRSECIRRGVGEHTDAVCQAIRWEVRERQAVGTMRGLWADGKVRAAA